jgi:hypothetical protein
VLGFHLGDVVGDWVFRRTVRPLAPGLTVHDVEEAHGSRSTGWRYRCASSAARASGGFGKGVVTCPDELAVLSVKLAAGDREPASRGAEALLTSSQYA